MRAARRIVEPVDDLITEAIRAGEHVQSHREERPLEHIRWTPPQLAWAECEVRRKLLRAGNQIGKTTIGLAEVIWRSTGTHPFIRTKPPPVEIWIVCTTWPQSVQIMKKFWELLPKHLVRTKTFDPRYGFGKDNPAVVFLCGSIVRFKTTNQGADALAGATIDYVLVDEPTDEDIYRELDRRLMRTGGSMGLVLTPINRPCEYLRQLCRDEVVRDIHARLTVQNLTPVEANGRLASEPLRLLDGTPMDEAWIAEQRRLVLPRFAPVILDGEWDQRVEGSVFAAWDPDTMVSENVPEHEVDLTFGADHGEGDFREMAGFAAVWKPEDHHRVHFLSEYSSDGMTSTAADARGVLDAMAEAGIESWRELASAVGDKPTTGKIGRKSNADLTAELQRLLRRRGLLKARDELRPPILTAKTGRLGTGNKSVWRGVEWLHQCMVRGDFLVHPRCPRLIESLTKWDGSNSEWKDAIDMARYATWPYAMRTALRAGPALAVA
jgi:phage terminase large subunit-like protein